MREDRRKGMKHYEQRRHLVQVVSCPRDEYEPGAFLPASEFRTRKKSKWGSTISAGYWTPGMVVKFLKTGRRAIVRGNEDVPPDAAPEDFKPQWLEWIKKEADNGLQNRKCSRSNRDDR